MICVETEKDFEEVQCLTRQAFWNLYQQGADEHFLLHKLRKSKDFISQLSLVMKQGNQIVAHIAYTHSMVTYESGKQLETVTFGPVSVLPSKQCKGLGSCLIKYSIEKAKDFGFKGIIIMGYPTYYSRFGFKCTKQANISLSDGIFYKGTMFLDLQQGYLTSSQQLGVFEQSPQFNVNKQECSQYDKKFPEKEKFNTLSQKTFQIVSQLQWNQQLPPNSQDASNRQKIQ